MHKKEVSFCHPIPKTTSFFSTTAHIAAAVATTRNIFPYKQDLGSVLFYPLKSEQFRVQTWEMKSLAQLSRQYTFFLTSSRELFSFSLLLCTISVSIVVVLVN